MEKERGLTNAGGAETAPSGKNKGTGGSPFEVPFKKPFAFEGETYESVDLSGLESLSAADMIAVNKAIERGGTVNVIPEMSLEYACLISARASGMPVEFFKALPPKEALKVKNRVTNFLYSED